MGFIYKTWYIFILLFLLYNLYNLYLEANGIEYADETDEFKYRMHANFSVCVPIGQVNSSDKFADSTGLLRFTTREMIFSSCPTVFSDTICSRLISLEFSYVYNFHVCFAFKREAFTDLFPFLENLHFKIFLYFDDESELFFYEHIYFHYRRSKYFQILVTYGEIINLEAPYESNCQWYTNQNVPFKTLETVQYRSACLIECFKLINRTLNFYYTLKDDRPLAVHQKDLEKNIANSWSMNKNLDKEEEERCRQICDKEDCRIRSATTTILNYGKSSAHDIKYTIKVVKAIPLMTQNTFIFEAIGLIVLLLNCSLNETSPALIFSLIDRLLPDYRNILNLGRIKKAILVLSLVLLFGFSAYSVITCLRSGHKAIAAIYYSSEISPFYLVVCAPVRSIMKFDQADEATLLKTKSLEEIEKQTDFDKFKAAIKYFAVVYASREKPVNWTLNTRKVWFKNYNFWVAENQTSPIIMSHLMRCYRIDFTLSELIYESLLGLSELQFNITLDWYIVHVLSVRQSFSSRHTPINPEYVAYKMGMERLVNCENYGDGSYAHCDSRQTCIGACINQAYLNEYGNLSKYSVIDKETISFDRSLDTVYFVDQLNEQIEEECMNKKIYEKLDCAEDIYKTVQRPYGNKRNTTFNLNLYYSQYILRDRVDLSVLGLIFNVVTLLSIFVGLNFRKFLYLFLIVLKTNLRKLKRFQRRNDQLVCIRPARHRIKLVDRLRQMLNRIYYSVNWSSFLIFVLCLILFSGHSYLIITEILYGDLSIRIEPSAFREIRCPNIVVCFRMTHIVVDENRPLTVAYLDELTGELDKGVFEKISYFDENYKTHRFNKSNKHSNIVSHFYFENLKCFEIQFMEITNDKYLYLLNEMLFVDLKFNTSLLRSFFKQDSIDFLFVNKRHGTEELNRMDRLQLNLTGKRKSYYFVKQEVFMFTFVDRYSWLKNLPYSLFLPMTKLNDTTYYINSVKQTFNREYQLQTKKLPLDPDDKWVIDDEMFRQFYLQRQQKIDARLPNDLNFEREV